MRVWGVGVAVLLLLAGVVRLQALRESLGPLPQPTTGAMVYIASPELARRFALSFDTLAADVYWIRAIQHYGGARRSAGTRSYDQLYPLLDLTTSLDPRFTVAYRFGAIFLSEAYPDGPGRPDLAIALLQKGLRAEPDRWEYAQDIGFVHYWWRRDYTEAARWFLRASEMPEAPTWLRAMAGITVTQGGSRQLARQLWRQILAESDLEWMRRNAEQRLQQLDAMDHLDLLRQQVRLYEQRAGRQVRSWADLLEAGVIRRVPTDPAGHMYVLDGAAGTITVSPRSPLSPLPTQPLRIDQMPTPQ